MTIMFDSMTAADDPSAPMTRAARFGAIDNPLVDRLHGIADRRHLTAYPRMVTLGLPLTQPALFCGLSQTASTSMVALCRAGGIGVDLCRTMDELCEQLAAGVRPSFVVIDLPAMGGLGAAFDRLRTLRLRHPNLPLLLVSDRFRHHDFSAERLGIADAWVHAPLDLEDLASILRRALDNNALWAARKIPAAA